MKTKKESKFDVINAIGIVSEKLENSSFKVKESKKFEETVHSLNKYFGTTDYETWILCAMISYYFDNEGGSLDFNDLSHFFMAPVMKVMAYKKEIESLLAKCYIKNSKGVNSRTVNLKNDFELSESFLECVLHNRKIILDEIIEAEPTIFDFVRQIGKICIHRYNKREHSCYMILCQCKIVEEEYESTQFVQDMKALLPDERYRMFFYIVCCNLLDGDDTILQNTILDIFDKVDFYGNANEFMNEQNCLFENDLIEFTNKDTLYEAEVTLSIKGKELFFGENMKLYMKSPKGINIIKPEDIPAKEMFYGRENREQVDMLRASLEEEKLKAIQECLKKNGMPSGLTVLFHGGPGTGKTETVYQLAKVTGRKIYHIDISSTKSCWFGESEKIIKRVFSEYKQFCKMCRQEKNGKAPILLFNEADGVLAKRKDAMTSTVDQTENTIQNIILEEMEKLDGIMIATTNLAGNLDAAFERRFLFKVKFEQPTIEAKTKIWKSKMDWLSDSDVEHFAQNYDLSGGQIDNVVRKAMMEDVLYGKHPSITKLEDFCKTERLCGDRKIGF